MDRRFIAMAASVAVVALIGVQPAHASQCTDACNKAYQQCSSASATDQTCLPKWGQCKKACAPKPAAAPANTTAAPAKTQPIKATQQSTLTTTKKKPEPTNKPKP